MNFFLDNSNSNLDWLPVSDLMALLMMFFFTMFIFRPEFLILSEEEPKIKKINSYGHLLHKNVSKQLKKDMKKNLKSWKAIFDDRNLSFKFQDSRGNTLFKQGSSSISYKFKKVLHDFCPKMVKGLDKVNAVSKVYEIRIEGHASPEWNSKTTKNNAYKKNMKLSQERAYNVFSFCFSRLNNFHKSKLRSKFTIGSYSSKKATYRKGKTNRMVEFKIVLKKALKIKENYVLNKS